MTAATTTDPARLPQWKGHAVPWVTRWTGEISETVGQVSMVTTPEGPRIEIGYKDGLENRDANGALWIREGINRSGEPQFSEFNTYRQRAAMTKVRCQVCGDKINSRVIRWLVANMVLDMREDGTATTTSPPTCDGCIPLALELCPHLKKGGWKIAKVVDYDCWGIFGEAIVMGKEGVREIRGIEVPYDRPGFWYRNIVAKQMIARWNKFVIEEEG